MKLLMITEIKLLMITEIKLLMITEIKTVNDNWNKTVGSRSGFECNLVRSREKLASQFFYFFYM